MTSHLQGSARRIIVLGTGGTISGSSDHNNDNIGYTAGTLDVRTLFAGINAPNGFVMTTEQVAQIDSKDMDFALWQRLAERCVHWLEQSDVAGIVITHGTDTLEETAFFLRSVLGPCKPVVLTCAMRPATALSPDGPQNMRDALVVASTAGACGVVVVCAGVIHGAGEVQKVHTYRLDAFSSGDTGPIGYVEESTVRPTRAWSPGIEVGSSLAIALATTATDWPHVEIVMSFAGARGAMVDALMAQRQPSTARGEFTALPVDGLVVGATGNGTIHKDLELALVRAEHAGVVVIRATRCTQGRILPKPDEKFRDAGALTPVKARVALLLELLQRDALLSARQGG